MNDELESGGVPVGAYVFILAFSATILFRIQLVRMPDSLDFVVAFFFGMLALAAAKVASYLVSDVLADIVYSIGEARVNTGAAQPIHSEDSDSAEAHTGASMPESVFDGDFIRIENKMVKLSADEVREFAVHVARSQTNSSRKIMGTISSGLEKKLSSLGVIDGKSWTEKGVTSFNIPV